LQGGFSIVPLLRQRTLAGSGLGSPFGDIRLP
jgi:hypothetical protein